MAPRDEFLAAVAQRYRSSLTDLYALPGLPRQLA